MKKLAGLVLIAFLGVACNSDNSLFKRAQLAASKGKISEAMQLYTRLLKQNPNAATAYLNRGVLWENLPAKDAKEKQKNRKFAEQDYLAAIEADSSFSQAYNNLGALYIELGRYNEAIFNLDNALFFTPTYFTARMNRAIAYSRLGDIAQALRDFDAAERLRKTEPILYFNRGVAYYNIKQYLQAVEDFSHAIMYDPKNPRFYLERARALDKAGYPANAYADLEEAITLQPSYAMAYYLMGDLLYRKGDWEIALGYMARAKELANQYVPIYELMGDMLAMQDPVAATANYMVAVKLDPANAAKYKRKINLMRTEKGREQVVTERFKPKDIK